MENYERKFSQQFVRAKVKKITLAVSELFFISPQSYFGDATYTLK